MLHSSLGLGKNDLRKSAVVKNKRWSTKYVQDMMHHKKNFFLFCSSRMDIFKSYLFFTIKVT